MESHSKHGDSIYWQSGSELLVNLFIPSTVDWTTSDGQYTRLEMTTAYPFDDTVRITVAKRPRSVPLTLSLRIPAWCSKPDVAVNDRPVACTPRGGYVRLTRTWKTGDVVVLRIPTAIRTESTVDDARTVAVLYGPLV
jgi:DUF1680 family protein